MNKLKVIFALSATLLATAFVFGFAAHFSGSAGAKFAQRSVTRAEAPAESMLAVSSLPFFEPEQMESVETPAATASPALLIPLTGGCKLSFDNNFESEVARLVNTERARFGLPALKTAAPLADAAKSHTQDMACNLFFSHTGSNGATVWDRIAAFGYAYTYAGENVAGGYATPGAVVAGWMSSPGHRANILSDKFTEIGVGYAYTHKGAYHHVVTAKFGAP